MNGSDLAAVAARPDGLPEWEDLLVRFEVMGRALRVTLEEARHEQDASAAVLRRIIRDETEVADWLCRARGHGDTPLPAPVARSDDPRDLADIFTSLRARNFAMLQRRGVDVWDWAGPIAGAGVVTAHQLVAALVGSDAAALAELRQGLRLGAAGC